MTMDRADTRNSTHGDSKRTLAVLAVVVAVCLGLTGGGVVWHLFMSLQDSLASRTAQSFVFEHPAAQELLGPPIMPDGPVLGKISEGDDTGTARLNFGMNGSRAQGHAVVTLVKAEGQWHVTAAELTGRDDVTRNLEVEQQKDAAPSTVAHARELYQSGNSRAALAELNTVLEQSRDDPEALYWRAQVHMRLGQEEAARDDVRRAVALRIDLREAYLLLDYLFAKQGRWEEIIAAWTQYLERHPDDAMALLERAGTYQHQGDMEHAFGDLRRSCELGNAQACTYLQRDKGG